MEAKQKVTIYTTSEFFGSVQAREGYLLEHGRKKYAQYPNAPFVKYIPKGKRKAVGFIKGFQPYLLICKGWDLPKPEGMYDKDKTKIENNVIINESKYSSFDDRFKSDFDDIINGYDGLFIADYRHKINQPECVAFDDFK